MAALGLVADVNKNFPERYLDAAADVVDPTIDWPEHDEHVRAYRRGAARCHVRRVVAALCGLDVEHDLSGVNAQRLDEIRIALREGEAGSVVLLPRTLALELRDVLLNDTVITAIEAVAGSEKTAELLGRLSLL
jgi:hypothetical protein